MNISEMDYKAWCMDKGYNTKESLLDIFGYIFTWPVFLFTPLPETIRHRNYMQEIQTGSWVPLIRREGGGMHVYR